MRFKITGYVLKPPLPLAKPAMLHMAKSLAKVDGALHIGADLHLHPNLRKDWRSIR